MLDNLTHEQQADFDAVFGPIDAARSQGFALVSALEARGLVRFNHYVDTEMEVVLAGHVEYHETGFRHTYRAPDPEAWVPAWMAELRSLVLCDDFLNLVPLLKNDLALRDAALSVARLVDESMAARARALYDLLGQRRGA